MEIEKAVDLAISNICKEGLTDIFERPFEVEMLTKSMEFQKKVREKTIACLKSGSIMGLGVSPVDYMLIPKNTAFNFRRCALMQPHDTIKYLALVLIVADTIEKARIPINQKKVFSYRFHPNKGYLFNKNYTIKSFQLHVSEKAQKKKTKLVISCDIANYYDRLNLHRLENILLSIGCEYNKVNMINELLLFWSNRDSYGLPVGSNASRILAEASLISVDNYLVSMGVDFIRFVDDFRFFAPDTETAHYWLTLLIERLSQEGLSINMNKTKIESSNKYIKGESNVKVEKRINNKEKNPFIIRAGYGGTVPTQFRKLSNKEVEKLGSENINQLIDSINSTELIESTEFVKLVKACIAQEKYEKLVEIHPLTEKYLQLTPYYLDVLKKHAVKFTEKEIMSIKKYFSAKWQADKALPEYLQVAYIRLFGYRPFENKELLVKAFRNLKRNSGAYVGRALLDSLYELVGREDALEIRNGFERADLWEKRQILRIIDNSLDKEEKRAWFKNIRQVDTKEIFLHEILDPAKKIESKKKIKGKR